MTGVTVAASALVVPSMTTVFGLAKTLRMWMSKDRAAVFESWDRGIVVEPEVPEPVTDGALPTLPSLRA